MFSKIIDSFKQNKRSQTTEEGCEEVTSSELTALTLLGEEENVGNQEMTKRSVSTFSNVQLISLKKIKWVDDKTIQIYKHVISEEAILRFHAGHRLPMVVDFKVGETYRRLFLGLSDIKEEEAYAWTERVWGYLIAHNPSLKKEYDLMCIEEEANGDAYYQLCLSHFLELTKDKRSVYFNFPGNRRVVQRTQDERFLIRKIFDVELTREDHPVTTAKQRSVDVEKEYPRVSSIVTPRYLTYEDEKVTLDGLEIMSVTPFMVTFMCSLWCPSIWIIILENGDLHYFFTTNKKELDSLQDLIRKPVQIFYLHKQSADNDLTRQFFLSKIASVRENIIFNEYPLDVDEHDAIVAWLELLENERKLAY